MMKELKIDNNVCFMCGEFFNRPKDKKTVNHGIPKMLKSKYNILFNLHESCHKILNKTYVVQQSKPKIPVNINKLRTKAIRLVKQKDAMEEIVMEIFGLIESDLKDYKSPDEPKNKMKTVKRVLKEKGWNTGGQ